MVAIPAAAQAASAKPNPGLEQKAAQNGTVPVIVQLNNKNDQQAVADDVVRGKGKVRVKYKHFPLIAATVDSQALKGLLRSPRVKSVQEDVAQPPALASTLPVINGDDVHNLGYTGTGWAVAILDTGIDRDHPFFAGRIVSEACYTNANGGGSGVSLCPDGTNAQTGAGSADAETAQCLDGTNNICDHGSHVAGIAAGSAAGVTGAPGNGVAPDGDIIAIQVFTRFNSMTDCGTTPTPCVLSYQSDQIRGLDRVRDLTATIDVAAANMSIGDDSNNTAACDGDAAKAAIDNLLGAGVATVISAGNEGHPAGVGNPGCISTAVTVGSTNDDDSISGFSNRGPRLDLFAPGNAVRSAVPDDAFGPKNGTSMAAPHVTGAFAVLRDAYPSASIATLLGYMTSTGVPITYDTNADGTTDTTTPRLNLLAALQAGNDPPVVAANNATVTVNEGSTATNTGTFSDPEGGPVTLAASVGTVTPTGAGTWSWSYGTNDGPTQSQTVTITGTDDKAETGTATFALTVDNVAPSVTAPANVTIVEGQTVNATATFSDPGWADTYSATIDWGVGDGQEPATLAVTTQGPPQDEGTASGSHQYGDDGVFTATVRVTDDDGGVGTASFTVTVTNMAPTATINEGDTVLINGVPTIIANAGEPVDFSGRSTDPGSDDLRLSWDWADGAPSPDTSTDYLVNPPATDPDPSPSVQPRDVTDNQTHAFGDACFYQVGFSAADDDGGTASDSVNVIIAGNADQIRASGYWLHQYRRTGRTDFTEAELNCYLAITGYMSTVFNEARSAATIQQAVNVLFVNRNTGTMEQLFEEQLLTAWLNFANGSLTLDEMVDTNGDGVVDTTFGDAVATAEAVRLDPNHTRAQLEAQKNILQRIVQG
jgi:subtilisin family serine protease